MRCNKQNTGLRLIIIFSTIALLIFNSCQKDWEMQSSVLEHRLAKWLTAGEGIWNIDKIELKKIDSTGIDQTLIEETNCGNMQFSIMGRTNGSLHIDYTLNGISDTGTVSWAVFGSPYRVDVYDGNVDTYFDIVTNKKKQQVWNTFYSDTLYSYMETFTMTWAK